jgi:chemotaxis protein CheD
MTPGEVEEVLLQPGQFHFGGPATRIRTLLGSCVAMVLWHPRRRIGGMCHYLLPAGGRGGSRPDGRYGEDAMALFRAAARQHGTGLEEYQCKLFGGGNMFGAPVPARLDVARQNVAAALRLVREHRLRLVAQSLGHSGHRKVVFEVWSGVVWVSHSPLKGAEEQG